MYIILYPDMLIRRVYVRYSDLAYGKRNGSKIRRPITLRYGRITLRYDNNLITLRSDNKLLPPNELDEVLPILLPGKIRHPLCPRLTIHPPQDPPYEQSWPATSRPGPCRGPLGPNLEPSHLLVHVPFTFYNFPVLSVLYAYL